MKNITFRPATLNDAETLYSVKLSAFSDEFEKFKYAETDSIFENIVEDSKSDNPKEEMFSMDWHKRVCSFGNYTLVIEDEAKIIGSIVTLPGKHSGHEYPNVNMSDDDLNVLICLYVLPEYKNKGIGQLAIKNMEALHPDKKWILDTPDVSIKNKHFYEKCGYNAGSLTGPNNILRIFTKGF